MDLAGGEDYAHTFREEFQQRGYSLWLPPTVAYELLHASETKSDPDAALAGSAISQLLDWQIFQIGLYSLDVGIAVEEYLAEVQADPRGNQRGRFAGQRNFLSTSSKDTVVSSSLHESRKSRNA